MEIENEGKKEKKHFSLFCCFSTNCGKNNSRKRIDNTNKKTASTTGIKSNISIQNNNQQNVKEFFYSNEKENTNNIKPNKEKNNIVEINVYSINSDGQNEKKNSMSNNSKINNNKNIQTFINENNNMKLSLLSSNNDNQNKSNKVNNIDDMNNNKLKIFFDKNNINNKSDKSLNETNKTFKIINYNSNNNISNSESSIKKNIIEENKEKMINNDECIKYEITNSDGINDHVNIYDNNNMSYNHNIYNNNENDQNIEQKNLNTAKDSFNYNKDLKHNFYPTDFNLNLSSDIKKNNQINSVLDINHKICLSNIKINDGLNTTNNNQSKDDTVIINSGEINQINEIKNIEMNQNILPKTKYKLNYSKSLDNLTIKNGQKNNLFNLYKSYFEEINKNNRSGIFFVSKNNLNNSNNNNTKIKFGFKYDKSKIKIKQNILEEPLNNINKEKTITFNEKMTKSQNLNYLLNNNILDISDEKENDVINPIISKSQKEIEQIDQKLNYINEKYFEGNINTNSNMIINNVNTETKKENENLDNNTNINNIQTNQENDEDKSKLNHSLTKKEEMEKNILDLEGEIEEADEEECSKKINDTKSIMSNYIINPLIGTKVCPSPTPQPPYMRAEFNFNIRDSKENLSNINNEIMSNKGSYFRPNVSNYNETEIEIMNENGRDFSSFIETPRASGVYNKRMKYKNDNYNMNNTYNFKNMNLKMKKIRDKINQNAKEIQRVNEKINNLDEQIKEYENCNKQYDMWIEKEEEESEMLINMLNFLNSNRK